MGTHQVNLELANLRRINANVAQLAYTRSHGVCQPVFRNQFVHHGAGSIDFLAGILGERYGMLLIHNSSQLFEGEIVAIQQSGSHDYFDSTAIYFCGSGRRWNLSSTTRCVVSPWASNVWSVARKTSYSKCSSERWTPFSLV